jgi:hypothetical protein
MSLFKFILELSNHKKITTSYNRFGGQGYGHPIHQD